MTVRRATWVGLPLLAALGRVSPLAGRVITFGLLGTLGIAHGANDDRIVARLAPRVPGGRNAISLAYGVFALGVFVAARRWTRTAARALNVLAWYHFGSGDVALAQACGATAPPFETFVRGAIPLAVGVDRFPKRIALVLVLSYAALHLVRGKHADALDVAVPAATLGFAPAPLGFMIYFAAWHAPRHLALVLERDAAGGSYRCRLLRFARESARNTLLALAAGAGVLAARRGQGDPRTLATALTLGITAPHQCAVWFAERADRRSRCAGDEELRPSPSEHQALARRVEESRRRPWSNG